MYKGLPAIVFLSLMVMVFLATMACRQSDPAKMSPEQRLAYARKLYRRDCAACHGEDGDGQGVEAYRLRTKPTNFTAGYFKFKSTPSGKLPLDEDIFRSIAEGVPTKAMLPQSHLTEGEIWALVDYIKRFNPAFETATSVLPVAIPTPPPPADSLLQLGAMMFKEAGCVKCHGDQGHGDGPAADSLRDYRGRLIEVPDLTYLPRKIGARKTDVYRVIQTGLDGTPMPSYLDVFTPEQAWALVYYLESIAVNQRPRGMMGLVGEETIGMHIDMRAARALMMHGRGMGRMMGRGMMGRERK